MNAHSMLFSLVCPCECVLYPIRQPVSTLPSPLHVLPFPHSPDVLFTSSVENGMAGCIVLDADVPTVATMPHGNLLAVVLAPSGDWSECCDFSFHCVALVRVCCTPPL